MIFACVGVFFSRKRFTLLIWRGERFELTAFRRSQSPRSRGGGQNVVDRVGITFEIRLPVDRFRMSRDRITEEQTRPFAPVHLCKHTSAYICQAVRLRRVFEIKRQRTVLFLKHGMRCNRKNSVCRLFLDNMRLFDGSVERVRGRLVWICHWKCPF